MPVTSRVCFGLFDCCSAVIRPSPLRT